MTLAVTRGLFGFCLEVSRVKLGRNPQLFTDNSVRVTHLKITAVISRVQQVKNTSLSGRWFGFIVLIGNRTMFTFILLIYVFMSFYVSEPFLMFQTMHYNSCKQSLNALWVSPIGSPVHVSPDCA